MEGGNLFYMTGVDRIRRSEQLFKRAVELEQCSDPEGAKRLYQQAVSLYPYNLGALVNLGTIFFQQGYFTKAEQLYRQAIAVDHEYALAHFNLANLLDRDYQRKYEAIQHYYTAIQIDPGYADAHYNLALSLQDSGCLMEAAKHWYKYLKLDPFSASASMVRGELDKIKKIIVVRREYEPF